MHNSLLYKGINVNNKLFTIVFKKSKYFSGYNIFNIFLIYF